ncbi:MAG: helix-turn-helix transcriptional regulator [Desulfobacteraceae bacterium]|nr:helix-turn-helix transcriptional regulator [Desulfobacteraceae bacterium]
MSPPLHFTCDYLPSPNPDKDRYGRYVYEVRGDNVPEEMFTVIPVKPGLILSYCRHGSLPCPSIDFEIGNAPVDFTYCLAGASTHRYQRFKGRKTIFEFTPRPGMNVISSLSHITGDMDFPAQGKIACVGLKVDPHLLFSYLEQQMDTVPKELATRFDKGDRHHCLLTREMTPQMQATAWQIINPPYTGKARELFLESRALELLAQQVTLLTQGGPSPPPVPPTPADLERIHAAKKILLKDLQEPPTIPRLARLSGINEFKLKRGFKQAFNTTIFGCLQQHRMKTAHTLLQDSSKNISQVASEVGYANVSHFINAYRKQFGITPGYFKKSINRAG